MSVNKPKKIYIISIIIVCFLSSIIPFGYSEENKSEADSELRYKELKERIDQFKKENSFYLIRLFEGKGRKATQALRRADKKKRAVYLQLKKDLTFWETVAGLKRDLVNNYIVFNPGTDEEELQAVSREVNRLARAIIEGIGQLQKEYGIHTFPIIHNFLIDLRLKKRGGCKHWAEDLLGIIDTVPHPHFMSYWGEAHPENILEHNVAVLAPKGAPFEQGILIDPWRTAGKPFWAVVKDDSPHWKMWKGYQPR